VSRKGKKNARGSPRLKIRLPFYNLSGPHCARIQTHTLPRSDKRKKPANNKTKTLSRSVILFCFRAVVSTSLDYFRTPTFSRTDEQRERRKVAQPLTSLQEYHGSATVLLVRWSDLCCWAVTVLRSFGSTSRTDSLPHPVSQNSIGPAQAHSRARALCPSRPPVSTAPGHLVFAEPSPLFSPLDPAHTHTPFPLLLLPFPEPGHFASHDRRHITRCHMYAVRTVPSSLFEHF